MKYTLDSIRQRFDQGDNLKFIFFWGHSATDPDAVGKFVFSQWFISPFEVDGEIYKSTEHWMMAQKALLFDNMNLYNKIMNTEKPAEAKALGREVIGFKEEVWNSKKYEIVKEGNLHKFSQNASLKKYLLETGDKIIVEASPNDSIWGIGIAQDASNIENPHTWKGQNLLGFAIMEVRDYITDTL